jgi:hypothetical protein
VRELHLGKIRNDDRRDRCLVDSNRRHGLVDSGHGPLSCLRRTYRGLLDIPKRLIHRCLRASRTVIRTARLEISPTGAQAI